MQSIASRNIQPALRKRVELPLARGVAAKASTTRDEHTPFLSSSAFHLRIRGRLDCLHEVYAGSLHISSVYCHHKFDRKLLMRLCFSSRERSRSSKECAMERKDEVVSDDVTEMGVASLDTKGSPIGVLPDEESGQRAGTGIAQD